MLHLYTGTDRIKSRAALNAAAEKMANGVIIRITDASTLDDLHAVMRGGGMFDVSGRVVVLDGVFANVEMKEILLRELQSLRNTKDTFFILEESLDAATRKQIEKYAETSERFDSVKKAEKDNSIFALADALKHRDKKRLWVGLQRQLIKGDAPEQIHGVLFWAAKQYLLSVRSPEERARGSHLVATLVELPHEARRQGEELDYALERFALSNM